MKLTVYLIRKGITRWDDVLTPESAEKLSYQEIHPRVPVGFDLVAWAQRNRQKPPRWVEWLTPYFDVDGMVNQMNSVVLGVTTHSRMFAVTLGYGFSAISRDAIEPDFGLRVALNTIDPEKLELIDTRSLDLVTKQTRIHLNVGRPLGEFAVSVDTDWLRAVRGASADEVIGGKVQGGDSVRLVWKGTVGGLGELCERLLITYMSTAYKQRFPFIDRLRRLRRNDPIVGSLNEEVARLVADRDQEHLTVALPELPHPDVDEYKIWCGHVSYRDSELDLDCVFRFLDAYKDTKATDPDLRKVYVIPLGSDDKPLGKKTPLWSYLVAHVPRAEAVYVLSLGEWFRVDKDYISSLKKTVDDMEDVTEKLALPEWRRGETEEEYNKRLAVDRKWLLLDRKLFSIAGEGRIECADIVTEGQLFVHVKAANRSSTLSHLFAQGTVSARLFHTRPEYREKVEELFREHYGHDFDMNQDMTTVYAIGTRRAGKPSEWLFFFSLVNLVQHKELLDAMRIPVAVCRIGRVDGE